MRAFLLTLEQEVSMVFSTTLQLLLSSLLTSVSMISTTAFLLQEEVATHAVVWQLPVNEE